MIQYTGFRTDIIINLENDIYQFAPNSATGKTRLFNLLKSYRHGDQSIVLYTYNDYINKVNLGEVLKEVKDIRLIFIDRYDLYFNSFAEDIQNYRDKSIILIDSKRALEFNDVYTMCGINMSESLIEVFG